MPFKPRKVESKLQNEFGFSPAWGHSSDHRWYELRLPRLPVILTRVSHSRKEITRPLVSQMARQCHVRTPFFRGMIVCTKKREDYYRQVRDDPYPPFDIRVF